jgi:hypothetical protein
MPNNTDPKFYEWLNRGIDAKWITPVTCWTHDSFDITPEEEKEMDEGGDPCIPIVRLWRD